MSRAPRLFRPEAKGGAMKDSNRVDYALLSTSTTLGRVRGFTIELLYHLQEGRKRCCELVEITGKSHPYVWRYLKRMRNYKLVEKNEGFWFLSDIGVNFVKHLNIVYNNIIEYRQIIDRKKKEERQLRDTSFTNVNKKTEKQIPISLWLQQTDREQVEKEVVEVLVDHYNETGSKFLFFKDIYAMAERFKATPDQINQAMMNLKQDHIVYNYRDRGHEAWKIGLYKDFVEALRKNE